MEAMDLWRTPKQVRRTYVDGDYGQIHLRENQAHHLHGLPLICLHPVPVSGRIFGRLLGALEDRRFAMAPDLPGYGLSDIPASPPSISDYAHAMGTLLDTLKLGPVALFGSMMGARVVVELALQRPDQVKALLLTALTLSGPGGTPPPLSDVALAEDGSHFDVFWREMSRAKSSIRTPSLTQRNVSDALLAFPDHAWGYDAAIAYSLEDKLPELTQPVLVLAYDSPLQETTRRAATLTPNATFIDKPDWDAGYLEFRAPELADIVEDFLADKGDGVVPGPLTELRLPRAGQVRRAFAHGPYGQLHYRLAEPLEPSQTPLTCFHASPQSSGVYGALLGEMGADRIALAPDTPGFGESEAPLTPPGIEDYASAMAGLLDTLGIQQTDVLGFHTGSMTAIELARQRPDLVRKIVMISAPIFSDDELADFRAHYTPITFEPDGSHNIKNWQAFWRWRGPGQTIENYARNNIQSMRSGPARHWGHHAAFAYPLAEALPEIHQPVLVLNPNDDLVHMTRRAEPLLKQGRIHDLPDLGHGMLDCATGDIAALLRQFLDA